MKICIPSQSPGGPDAIVSTSFEEAELLDYYEIHEDGNFDHTAQMRLCDSGCSDPVEAIARRGTEAIVVASISPGKYGRFGRAGVMMLRANNPSARGLIDSLVTDGLEEMGSNRLVLLRKT